LLAKVTRNHSLPSLPIEVEVANASRMISDKDQEDDLLYLSVDGKVSLLRHHFSANDINEIFFQRELAELFDSNTSNIPMVSTLLGKSSSK
jgi:hypothetical protein